VQPERQVPLHAVRQCASIGLAVRSCAVGLFRDNDVPWHGICMMRRQQSFVLHEEMMVRIPASLRHPALIIALKGAVVALLLVGVVLLVTPALPLLAMVGLLLLPAD